MPSGRSRPLGLHDHWLVRCPKLQTVTSRAAPGSYGSCKMKILTIFLVSVVLTTVNGCPDGCTCQHNSLSCHWLSKQNYADLLKDLTHSSIDSLHVVSTADFSIEDLPTLASLSQLTIENCSTPDPWLVQRNRFPNVRKLRIIHSNITSIARSLVLAFPMLEELDLGYNQIFSLGSDSIHLPRVKKLSLNNNRIEVLGVHILRYMPQLLELDLSSNMLTKLVTSDFSSASTLRILRINRNQIKTIECDTSTQMPAIESLDLSFNELSEMPGDGLRDMEQIVRLNLSFNPINAIPHAALRLPNLQVLDLSNTLARVVEAGAFSYLPHLHTLHLQNNKLLLAISALAFQNNSIVFSMDISNTALRIIPAAMFNYVSRVDNKKIGGTRFDCGCILESLEDMGTTTMVDWDSAICVTRKGAIQKISELTRSSLTPEDTCRPDLFIPQNSIQTAYVGDTYHIHCLSNLDDVEMSWKTPKNLTLHSFPPQLASPLPRLDYFTSSLFEPASVEKVINRTKATTEYFGIDVVLGFDNGTYECTSRKDGMSASKRIHLIVKKPDIVLNATHVGVTSVHLAWNKNLHVQAVDKVALQVVTYSGSDFKREVQLSLFNMYCSYNLINLSPDKEYKICLEMGSLA
ncbi:unnamed protein product [Caenorhabditis auriculariae]|uniref:Ig-like domain-containing protein n=1 Tax=Caenorhabditis auriculariae TaxID=2777116 RepID=A0A8S1GZH5_9PELO|nr:unnamed protein product [Caenorhabditis auriculariae]